MDDLQGELQIFDFGLLFEVLFVDEEIHIFLPIEPAVVFYRPAALRQSGQSGW